MLSDDDAGIDGDDFSIWECLLEGLAGSFVVVRLVVGGHDDGSVDHQEIGVSGWQLLVIEGDGSRHGQR